MNREIIASFIPKLSEVIEPISINVPSVILAGLSAGIATYSLAKIGEKHDKPHDQEARQPDMPHDHEQ